MSKEPAREKREPVRVTDLSKLGEAMGVAGASRGASGAGGTTSEPPSWRGGLPLRQPVAGAVRARMSSCHPGLAFAKFAGTWATTPGNRIGGPEKKNFLEQIVRLMEAHKPDAGGELYGHFVKRRSEFLEDLKRCQGWVIRSASLKTLWRLVSGLGIAHPFETGFVFDHTYGVPYLPGSSVKGAARAWAEEVWDSPAIDQIFGAEDGDPLQGGVVFFDAYPAKWPELEVDILNPHYKAYYEGREPPADWLLPEPTYFLALKAKQPFVFAVGVKPTEVSPQAAQRAETLADEALKAVRGAARELGLGGKTAVGYGYFA